jgi:hypothetical protein
VDPPVLAVFVRLGFAEAVIEEQDALAVWDVAAAASATSSRARRSVMSFRNA